MGRNEIVRARSIVGDQGPRPSIRTDGARVCVSVVVDHGPRLRMRTDGARVCVPPLHSVCATRKACHRTCGCLERLSKSACMRLRSKDLSHKGPNECWAIFRSCGGSGGVLYTLRCPRFLLQGALRSIYVFTRWGCVPAWPRFCVRAAGAKTPPRSLDATAN